MGFKGYNWHLSPIPIKFTEENRNFALQVYENFSKYGEHCIGEADQTKFRELLTELIRFKKCLETYELIDAKKLADWKYYFYHSANEGPLFTAFLKDYRKLGLRNTWGIDFNKTLIY